MFFPTFVLGTISAVLSPVVKGCNQMLESQTFDMKRYRQQKDLLEYEAMMRNPETSYLVDDAEFERQLDELGWTPGDVATNLGMRMERGMYKLKKGIRDWFRELLEILFQAAALVIDTVRTFYLIVLSILGPIAFAISIYDGFQSTLTQWITRYVSVYFWLPVSDLFSCVLAKIQILMLQNDISQLQSNSAYSIDASNTVYIIFLLIGIVGYFTIPTVSNWIITAGGISPYNRNLTGSAAKSGAIAGAITSRVFRK
jgi:conjugative transposon TraJ protein